MLVSAEIKAAIQGKYQDFSTGMAHLLDYLVQHAGQPVSLDDLLIAVGKNATKKQIGKGSFKGLDSRESLLVYMVRLEKLLAAQDERSPLAGLEVRPCYRGGKPHAGVIGYCLCAKDDEPISLPELIIPASAAVTIWSRNAAVDMGLFTFEPATGWAQGVLRRGKQSVGLIASEVQLLSRLWQKQGDTVPLREFPGMDAGTLWRTVRGVNEKIHATFGHEDVISPNYMSFSGYRMRTMEDVTRETKLIRRISALDAVIGG